MQNWILQRKKMTNGMKHPAYASNDDENYQVPYEEYFAVLKYEDKFSFSCGGQKIITVDSTVNLNDYL